MKRLILLLTALTCSAGITWSQANMYDCDAYSPLTEADLENTATFYRPCVAFVPGTSYDLSGDINVTISSATTITAADGLYVHGLDPGSVVHLKPGQGTGPGQEKSVDVNIMNYPSWENILTYKRMELGVVLPDVIETRVNNFVGHTGSNELNPYVDWELRVYAVFTPPVGSGLAPITVDGFYNKEYNRWEPAVLPIPAENTQYPGDRYSNNEYQTLLGGWDDPGPDDFPFRIRFAPPVVGNWQAQVFIETADGIDPGDGIPFTVIDSHSPGYVKVGPSGRFLEYDNQTFIPVGCNIFWPETDTIVDPELHNYLCGMEGYNVPVPYYAQYSEGQRPVLVAPRVYRKFKDRMTDIASHDANWLRFIMEAQSTEIEWEKLGDYTGRLNRAQEMDEILEHAENLGVFLHWNFQLHTSFQEFSQGGGRNFVWDREPQGEGFCYKDIPGINGPLDFFIDPSGEAKKYYKQRLRYILARWGYSTNIGMFELFSEISNASLTNVNGTSETDYSYGDNYVYYQEWQKEMAAYIKSQYGGKIHLLTASYAAKHYLDNTYSSPDFDVMSTNCYDHGSPDFGTFLVENVSGGYVDDGPNNPQSFTMIPDQYGKTMFIKPVIFSETEPRAHTNPLLNEHCPPNYIELKRAMWQNLFSGLALGVPWTAANFPALYGEFAKMRKVIDGFNFGGQEWHPATSDLIYYPDPIINGWHYNSEYAKNVINNRNVDAVFMRSGDGNFAVGIISNKTMNCRTLFEADYCFDYPELSGDADLDEREVGDPTEGNISSNDDRPIRIHMPHNDKYYVNYYHLDDEITHFGSSDDEGNYIRLRDVNVIADQSEFLVLVEIRREGYNFPASFLKKPNEQYVEVPSVLQFEDIATLPNVEQTEVEIFPSPTNGVFNVLNSVTGDDITITTTEGKTIFESKITSNKMEIDLSSYATGTYLIKVSSNGHLKAFKRLVKL